MKRLDVEHYLSLYKFRKEMMEKGITNPLPQGKKLINEIISKLSKMPSDEEIELRKKDGKLVMMDSKENIIVIVPTLENN
ncbi:hypothetical protein [Maribacter sp. 2307UL18-2]|uniref:hypothetical protein n=1 Tax=Maribacter sp. 2307UL18-2 TaxID=3386274 RepID=UPI0039BD79D0